MAEPHKVIDQDTSDAFLDKPPLVYSNGNRSITGAELDAELEKAARGEIILPKLPPPTEH